MAAPAELGAGRALGAQETERALGSSPAAASALSATPIPAVAQQGIPAMKKGGHLTAAARAKIPSKDFALPGGRYPIEDRAHGANALARVSQFGTPSEKATVRAAVHRKYPDMGKK